MWLSTLRSQQSLGYLKNSSPFTELCSKQLGSVPVPSQMNHTYIRTLYSVKVNFIELFHQPTLMHNFYSLTICLLHYYPRHVSSINMPIFRRKLLFTQHLVSSLSVNFCTVHWLRAVSSQPVYCADVYRERRYQMLCE